MTRYEQYKFNVLIKRLENMEKVANRRKFPKSMDGLCKALGLNPDATRDYLWDEFAYVTQKFIKNPDSDSSIGAALNLFREFTLLGYSAALKDREKRTNVSKKLQTLRKK